MDGCSALRFCLFVLCASYREHLHMSVCIQKPLATNSKQVTCHGLCTVWADKCLVCAGVHAPLEEGGGGGAGKKVCVG